MNAKLGVDSKGAAKLLDNFTKCQNSLIITFAKQA